MTVDPSVYDQLAALGAEFYLLGRARSGVMGYRRVDRPDARYEPHIHFYCGRLTEDRFEQLAAIVDGVKFPRHAFVLICADEISSDAVRSLSASLRPSNASVRTVTTATRPECLLRVRSELWKAMEYASEYCESYCCGKRAYRVEVGPLERWAREEPAAARATAMRQLDELIDTLRESSGPVNLDWFNQAWNGPEAADWFETFRDCFRAAERSA